MSDRPPPPHIPPPHSPPVSRQATRLHPLAVVAMVLSVLGFVPLVIVGGLIGSLLGAVALGRIHRQPERYRGTGLAGAAVAVGLVSGVLVLATFAVVRSDDWGWTPLIATAAYGGLVIGLAVVSRTTAGRAGGAAALGLAGIVAAVVGIIGLVLLVTLVFTVIGEAFIDAILGRD